jgi:hypothetical protein
LTSWFSKPVPDYLLKCNKLVNQYNKEVGIPQETTCREKIQTGEDSGNREMIKKAVSKWIAADCLYRS